MQNNHWLKPQLQAISDWRLQRISALLLAPLSIWLIVFLQKCLHGSFADVWQWLHNPINRLGVFGWLLIALYHAALGCQVVLEDYVSNIPLRHRAIDVSRGVFLLIMALVLAVFVLIQIR